MLLSSSSSFKNSSSFFRSPVTQWKRPVEHWRAPQIHTLRLVPGVLRCFCLPRRIQQNPTLGLSSSLGIRPGKRPLSPQHLENSFEPFLLLFGIFGRRDGAGSSPAKSQAVQHATHSLLAYHQRDRSLTSSKAKSLQLQRERSPPHARWAASLRSVLRSVLGPCR
jgi:hypothetical protein